MKKRGLLLFIFAIIFAFSANANIFLGTCDGYILDMSGGLVSGANVSLTVSGCSGGVANGCSGNDLSQSNGYYVIPNLNANPGNVLNAYATATISGHEGTGSTSTLANTFQAGRANVTLCFPPNASKLIDTADAHYNSSIGFYWNSGEDPFGYSTFDQFQLDSGAIQTTTSPVILNVSYSSHTWRVRTCNTNGAMGCCSPFADDTFVIYNNAPLPPTLVHVNNSHLDSAVFYWTNGSDIDNDSIYHQFQFDSEAIQNNSFSPVSTTGIAFGSHTWRVRACDFLTCSAWAEDTFSRSNNAPSAPALFAITNTTGASVTLNWTPGTDPENDPVYDDFQFSIYYDFSTNIVSLSNTTRPVNVAGLSAFEKYYWRVRTCDGQSCSAWSASSFVKYLCTNATQNCTASCNCNCGGGGGHAGGGGGVTSLPPQKLVQIILPSGTIEVAPPEIVKAGNATNITKEVAEAKPLLELPFSVITSKVTKINWLIIVLIAAIILAILISRKIRENKRRKKRIQELLKGI